MSNLKGKSGSYCHNVLLISRDDDRENSVALIDNMPHDVICRLNGYAIIPIEKYYELSQKPIPEGTIERIAEMNIKLNGG